MERLERTVRESSGWSCHAASSERTTAKRVIPRQQNCNTDSVIVRIWSATIDPDRADEYENFAYARSLPMFRSHTGFLGCAFLRDGADCTAVTLWESAEDVAALEASARYRETVAAIMAAGFILTASNALAATASL
ncbi:hypothetical protein ACIBCD_41130 [Nocardia brasiliensis]|uniref:hypothetical protein n=1 Tax=Nocardia brasiliensis TaxID=37326 RepID=UPI0037B302FC